VRPALNDLNGYIGCQLIDLGANYTWTISTPPFGYDLRLAISSYYNIPGILRIYDGPMEVFSSASQTPSYTPIVSYTSTFYVVYKYGVSMEDSVDPVDQVDQPITDQHFIWYYDNYDPYGDDTDLTLPSEKAPEAKGNVRYCDQSATINVSAPFGQIGCLGFAKGVTVTWTVTLASEGPDKTILHNWKKCSHQRDSSNPSFTLSLIDVAEESENADKKDDKVIKGTTFTIVFASTEASEENREGFFLRFGGKKDEV